VQSRLFKKNAGKLKNAMWWQNKKMCMILTLVIIIILAIIGIIIYVKTK
jgi:vesicle-associated membrane protein 1/vesicle-associated membrane protein 2